MKRKSVFLAVRCLLILAPLEFANAGIITNGLVGYWGANNNANDSSPMGNNGSFSGSYVAGINGQAFDLSTGKVYISDNPTLTFGSGLTVGFWFNINGTNTNNVAFLGQDDGSGSNRKWFIDYDYKNRSCFELHVKYTPSTGTFLPTNPVALADGWNQLTLVKDNSNYFFYLNGIGIGSQTFGDPFPDPSSALIFGSAESFSFNGLMDNVVLYNRALTASEVQTLATVPEPATLLLLTLGGLLLKRRK
jgi:hypothetical protein